MARALQLATMGGTEVSPNPFVGAVIVAQGRIIGEGYHRRYGGPHAEVNALRSVSEADRELLGESTMYVTLEPCSHFGKTPPCADLILSSGIRRVVVATEDPFEAVSGKGIAKLRAGGVEVEVGLMRDEARYLNRRFFTAHELKRPYILLKWAQSADGFIAGEGGEPVKLSTPYTSVLMHRERAFYDAIFVGTDTILNDNPRLTCRLWPTRDPERRPLAVTFDSPRLRGESKAELRGIVKKPRGMDLGDFMHSLYESHGVTSLMVEGGRKTLESFIEAGLFDETRIEVSPITLGSGIRAPEF